MLVADVFVCSLIDEDGNIFATSTLQNAGLDFSSNLVEVRGGRGNSLLATLPNSRDINIKLTDAYFRYDFLATQLGTSIVTGAGTAWSPQKFYTVGTNSTITLDETPLASGSGLQIYDDKGALMTAVASAPTATQYTISTNTVTFNSAMNSKVVDVRGYKYTTDETAQTITIDNSKFPIGMKAILETIEIDENNSPKYKVQYQFDSAIGTGAFSVNTTSERNANVQEFNFKVVKPSNSNDIVGRIIRIPIS